MPARIRELIWDDNNIEHIARHNIYPSEVEDVCFENPVVQRSGKGRKALYGQTSAGRYLLIILGERGNGIFRPITARDMNDTERRYYRERRRG
jgi:uncharacterized DUF497 family protein